jgi:hypothetical protein
MDKKLSWPWLKARYRELLARAGRNDARYAGAP